MTDLRTTLQWLTEQHITGDAECWLLADATVLPVTDLAVQEGEGSLILVTSTVWSEPTPVPLHYERVYAKLMDSYSGAGRMKWAGHVNYTYRGSYVVDPTSSVFFLFLPEHVQLIEPHSEKMEKREQQARQLTEEIEHPWQTST
jgi:hypothetical protein